MSWLGANNRGFTPTPSGQGIVWNPGHRIFPGSGTSGNRDTPNLANAQAAMDKTIAWDVNNQIKGFLFPFYMSSLEGATAGDYSAGFTFVGGLINRAKSYNPPRDISFYINLTGNGSNGSTSTAFPSWFVPAYLNSSFYGGGCEWGGAAPYAGTSSQNAINGTFWNVNFMTRVSALIQAYYAKFGPDTPTGGIYLIDLFSEISIGTLSAGTNSEFAASLNSVLPGLRAGAPKLMMSIRLTFGLKGTSTDLVNCANAMFANKIAMANEDHTNMVQVPSAVLTSTQQNAYFAWGDKIYKGVYPGTSVDHSVTGDWAHVGNVEIAEYGLSRSPLSPVPNADKGSGYLYDNPSYPGIMSGTNFIKSSHIFWHVDEGQFGPNINNTTYYSTAPNNPTPGPGAGSNAARPHLGDVLTGNTAYAGITGPIAIPGTTRPLNW